ncbi:ABC transporter permease subunit [Weissella confusa]|uniref:ABC transporter permease subunit n=1 Tax=Weissella confusa TaxID=1583 RepID=A0A923NJA2_WEICO|nr:ABC transporter permease subunit [Weissella confusa]
MTESALSFLGMGVQDPTASWGSLLNAAQSRLQDAPYMAIIPGVFIMLTVLAFNKLGNLLRELTTIIVIISIFSWMSIARLVRAEVVTVKERDFVVYAQFVGEKSLAIMWHHLIPMVAPIIVAAAGTKIYGGRISLTVGFLSMAVSVVLGTLVGTIAGYYGGWIDVALMRLLDVFSAIPWLVLVVVLSAMLRPGIKRLLTQRPSYFIWIGIMVLLVILTIFAPLLPLHPNAVDVANMSQGPTLQHWFGTDDLGRDYLARVGCDDYRNSV